MNCSWYGSDKTGARAACESAIDGDPFGSFGKPASESVPQTLSAKGPVNS